MEIEAHPKNRSDLAWIDRVQHRAGPFWSVAHKFLASPLVRRRSFPAGHKGVRWLADVLDTHLEDDSSLGVSDFELVEGAGACLGLLLLEHVHGARHEQNGSLHRIALGAHGYFDPFAAIEATVAADDPTRELAKWLRQAEAEARGDGPVSKAVTLFIDVLGAQRPELRLESHFEWEVMLSGGIEVNLRSAGQAGDADPAAVRKALGQLVQMLPKADGNQGLPWADARAQIYPRIVGDGFFEGLGRQADLVAHEPIGNGASLGWVLRYEQRCRYVRRDEVQQWGLTLEQLRRAALENLASVSERARFHRMETEGGALIAARSGDGLDSARLLLPALHSVLARELGSPLVVGTPHRDALFACAAGDRHLVEALRARVREDADRAPHRITHGLWVLDEIGIRPES